MADHRRSRGRSGLWAALPGLILLLVLAAGVVLSAGNPSAFQSPGRLSLLDGSWVSRYEERFEESLPLRPPAAVLWDLIRYTVFGEGAPGVLVGREGWLFTAEEFLRVYVSFDIFFGQYRLSRRHPAHTGDTFSFLLPVKVFLGQPQSPMAAQIRQITFFLKIADKLANSVSRQTEVAGDLALARRIIVPQPFLNKGEHLLLLFRQSFHNCALR